MDFLHSTQRASAVPRPSSRMYFTSYSEPHCGHSNCSRASIGTKLDMREALSREDRFVNDQALKRAHCGRLALEQYYWFSALGRCANSHN
jgi:hypothetical protein